MIRLSGIALLLIFLSACGKSKLVVSEIRTLEFEYSPGTNLNFGTAFQAKVKALMNNGDEIDITTHRKLQFASNDINKAGSMFTVSRRPQSFDEYMATFTLTVSDKEESFVKADTLIMNFRGGLDVIESGGYGSGGLDQKERGAPWLLRDGKPGEEGGIGGTGGSGGELEIHIWKEGDFFLVHVLDTRFGQLRKYKTLATDIIRFDVSGGPGGRGGKGGSGSNGKDGEKDDDGKLKRPGNGGNGGDGGTGGDGGAGGSVHLIIHPDAAAITAQLQFDVSGGPGGQGGQGGKAGKAGTALSGQLAASPGKDGRQGRVGRTGDDGSIQTELLEFDPSVFR